jgi:hypothetical protein
MELEKAQGHITNYIECTKQGIHLGETLNMVCMEPDCLAKNDFVCCCACIEESHQKHTYTTQNAVSNH